MERLLYSRRWVQIEGMLVEAVTVYLAEIARNKVPDLDLSVDDLESYAEVLRVRNGRSPAPVCGQTEPE